MLRIKERTCFARSENPYTPLLADSERSLRANIDETIPLVVITEQGEKRNQCEEERNLFDLPHGFACRGT